MNTRRLTPITSVDPVPAAALVLNLAAPVKLDPMYAPLAAPEQRTVTSIRLLPVLAVDFYARGKG